MTSKGMTVICGKCRQPIDYNQKARHERNCTSEDSSDIGVVDPDDGDQPTNRYGEAVEKRTHPECDLCERDILAIQYQEHVGQCNREDEPVDIAVAEEGTTPVCAVCSQKVEQEQFREHVIDCSRANNDSDLGVVEDE